MEEGFAVLPSCLYIGRIISTFTDSSIEEDQGDKNGNNTEANENTLVVPFKPVFQLLKDG